MTLTDRLLLYYSTLFALILTLGALLSGFALTNLAVTIFFLPISLYFVFFLVKSLYIHRLRADYARTRAPSITPDKPGKHRVRNPNRLIPNPNPQPFGLTGLTGLLHQHNPVLIATIGLYGLIFALVIVKATLNYLPKPELIYPIPQDQSNSRSNR
jgi:hypothetical protein